MNAPAHTVSAGRPRTVGLALAVLLVVLDQVSKYVILYQVMSPPRVIEVTSFFNLVLTWNRGVSFGMFNQESDYGPMLLTALALGISVALGVWLWRADRVYTGIALGGIIGGALGNVIDRLQYGAVVDFLDLHAFGYHWPAFNVADSAISVGAAMLIADTLFRRDETS